MYQENDETDHIYSYVLPKLNTGNRTMVVGASVKVVGWSVEGKNTVESVTWLQTDDCIGGSRRLAYPYFTNAFIILFFLLYRILLISVFYLY